MIFRTSRLGIPWTRSAHVPAGMQQLLAASETSDFGVMNPRWHEVPGGLEKQGGLCIYV